MNRPWHSWEEHEEKASEAPFAAAQAKLYDQPNRGLFAHRVGRLAKAGLGARAGVREEVLWGEEGREGGEGQNTGPVCLFGNQEPCVWQRQLQACPAAAQEALPDAVLEHEPCLTWNREPLAEELGRRRIHRLMAHEPAEAGETPIGRHPVHLVQKTPV